MMTILSTQPAVVIAANNGDLGGGEVMLLAIARALADLGISVSVLGPQAPDGLVTAARDEGWETICLPAQDRCSYMIALARWRLRHPRVPLWCNGLVPSLATAGIGPRIVHLHMLPEGSKKTATALARTGARATLVPSQFVADHVRGSQVLSNWTADLPLCARQQPDAQDPLRIGYLGRMTRDKGVDTLADAVGVLRGESSRDVRLVLAGENRFGDEEDDRAIARALTPLGDAVEHRGWVKPLDLLREVDLLVVPSRTPETFGLVAAEAMAAGVPLIVSDAGALPEVVGVRHPWIATAGDSADLARCLRAAMTAITDDHESVARIVGQARARWEQRFSPSAGLRGTAQMLSSLVEDREEHMPSRWGRGEA